MNGAGVGTVSMDRATDALTISQLASYAGVTVATVRHYHRIGLLPEPARDASDYRRYDAAAVVRLIRIHVLASAGVPLAKVDELLEASPTEFEAEVEQLDRRLRAEMRGIQHTRELLAGLAAGEQLALPESVVGYLERLRDLGVGEQYLELERDAWILVAAQIPDRIDDVMAGKVADLADPDVVQLYTLLSGSPGWTADDPHLVELADIVDRIHRRALESGRAGPDGLEDRIVDLLDSNLMQLAPFATRLLELLEARGWAGWTRLKRAGGQ